MAAMQPPAKVNTGIAHSFSKAHFNSPTFCDHCGEFIWGLGRQGYSCRVCRFAIHKRCLEANPTTCSQNPVRRSNVSFVVPEIISTASGTEAVYIILEVIEAREASTQPMKRDFYCGLEFSGLKQKTRTLDQTYSPYWNEKFAFQAEPSSKNQGVGVQLFESHRWSIDEKLGGTTISIAPFLESENAQFQMVKDQWYKLENDKAFKDKDFELHLKIWAATSEFGQPPAILKECHMFTRQRANSASVQRPQSQTLSTSPVEAQGQVKDPIVFTLIKNNDVNSFMNWIENATLNEINTPDQWGFTPLTFSCSLPSDEAIINRLLEVEGIDVRAKNRDGNTALHYFCQKFESPDCFDPFNAFIKKGADVNAKNINGETPLFKAIFNRSIRLILTDYLLENGADVNILNPFNEGVLHYAVRLGREDLVSALLNAGADISVRGNKEMKTPFELAKVYKDCKMANHLQAVQELIEWLEKNNLVKYKLNFFKKELFLNSFRNITESTLDEMGILDAEERRKVMDHVNKLRYQSPEAEKDEKDKDDIAKIITDLQVRGGVPDEIEGNWIIKPEDLEFTKKLGSGAAGDVYRGLYKGKTVAIKVLKEMNSEKEKEEFTKEFKIMSALRSNFLVYLFGVAMKPKLCMVMELCSRGSLFDILQDESFVLGWERMFQIIIDSVSGVLQLHSCVPEILHRDLKSLNLLVSENWHVKVCDFGLSRFNQQEDSETLQKMRGTMAYCAPETYFGVKFTTKSDVFSCGVILWELVNACIKQKYERPYAEFANLKFDFQIIIQSAKQKLRPTIPPTTPPLIKELIVQCFSPEPEQRPTCKEMLDQLKNCFQDFKKNPAAWNSAILPKGSV